jgi:hypothetical protein
VIPGARREALAASLLFLGIFLVYERSPITTSVDSYYAVPIARSIVHDGDTDLEEIRASGDPDAVFGLVEVDGHLRSYFPIGAPLLAAPLVALHDAVFGVERARDAEKRAASFLTALAAVVVFAIARRQLALPGAAGLALVFALCTPAWSTASRGLWSHGPGMLLVAGAWWLLLEATPRSAALAGLALGLAYATRPTHALSIAAFGTVVLATRRAVLWPFAGALALALGAFVAWSHAVYGDWLPPYYQSRLMRHGGGAFADALAGLLVSPSRGLLIYSPIFLLLPLGVFLAIRRRRFGAFEAAALAILVAHTAVCATFPHWWGGSSYGPRLFTDVMPHATLLLAPVLAWIAAGRGAARVAVAGLFATLAAASFAIHLRGATSREVWTWHSDPVPIRARWERIWDWSDPQFLRGLGPPPARPASVRAGPRDRLAPTLGDVSRRTRSGSPRSRAHVEFGPGEVVVVQDVLIGGRARFLEAAVDHDDAYVFEIVDGDRVLCRFEDGPRRNLPGLRVYRFPLTDECRGASALRVTGHGGDGRFALGHVAVQ